MAPRFSVGPFSGSVCVSATTLVPPARIAEKPDLTLRALTLVILMADRMHKLSNATRRENYIARARKRLEAGHPGKNDAAVVLPRADRLAA